jgi:hypothetical protein
VGTIDEAIVNTCYVLILKLLTYLAKATQSKWSLTHINFKSTFQKGSFTAKTDGGLLRNDNQVQAIIEVKPRPGLDIYDSVRCQEAADPSDGYRLPAQDPWSRSKRTIRHGSVIRSKLFFQASLSNIMCLRFVTLVLRLFPLNPQQLISPSNT